MNMSNSVTFSIYAPKDLKDWLEAQAKKERRPLNNYLVMILEDLRNGRLVKKEETEERAPATLRRAF